MTALWAFRGAAIAAISAFICVGLIVFLYPALQRFALAKPNARSSHRHPTPQGGGIVVIACIGAADDIRPLDVAPRLTLQALAVLATIYALPNDLRVISFLPLWL